MGYMETRNKMPAEAVELYSQFIHGEIGRRAFFDGLKRYAVGGLTVTAMAEALMPNYALGQQIRKDDERIKASYETVPSPNGHGYIKGYFVRPFSADSRSETPAKLPGVIIVHENRGLNPHTEDVARRFALENFNAFAPDALSSMGGYPGDDYKGGLLFAKLDPAKRLQDFIAAARWLKARADGNGKICATGFCFGAGWPILWRSSWATNWPPRRRSTAVRPSRRMCRKSRPLFLFTTARWIRTWRGGIPRRKLS
jgi:carboxymethylenebutenolidase